MVENRQGVCWPVIDFSIRKEQKLPMEFQQRESTFIFLNLFTRPKVHEIKWPARCAFKNVLFVGSKMS